MKKLAIALGAAALVAGTAVMAQDNSDRNYPFDPYAVQRQQELEVLRDTRINDYRANDYRLRDDRWRDDRRDDRREYRERDYRDQRFHSRNNQECWNPRARHYEGVRPDERQDDLDFSRCRAQR